MVVIAPAAPVHTEEAASVLAGALQDDTMMGTFIEGRPEGRDERLAHLFQVMLRTGMRHGAVDLARGVDGALLGAAVWTAPGSSSGGLGDRLRDLRSYARAFGPRGLSRARALDVMLHAARPSEPHWYLAVIGVHPAGHGRGVGSALLDARLSVIDGSGAPAPAYLEASTPRSAALYERFGFTPTGRVEGFPAGADPIAMWRPGTAAAGLSRQTR